MNSGLPKAGSLCKKIFSQLAQCAPLHTFFTQPRVMFSRIIFLSQRQFTQDHHNLGALDICSSHS